MKSVSAQPSSDLFFDTISGFQRTAALKAAIELNLFGALSAGVNTVCELAARLGASERGIRILCNYLTILSFLSKKKENYRLTQDSATFHQVCFGFQQREKDAQICKVLIPSSSGLLWVHATL